MLFSQPPRVSRRTAQRNLARATKFLSTLSRVPEVRAALERGAGYSEQDHALGWSLLLIALGYIRKGTAATPGEPVSQQAALIELDEWDGVNFERARATLKFNFPEQHDYLFQGLTAATGADAIGTVQTFVERVAALRDGTVPVRPTALVTDCVSRGEVRAGACVLPIRRSDRSAGARIFPRQSAGMSTGLDAGGSASQGAAWTKPSWLSSSVRSSA
jgi:hypothetical protein